MNEDHLSQNPGVMGNLVLTIVPNANMHETVFHTI